MIGYMLSWDGVAINSGFGQNSVQISRAVAPSKSRILGGATYDLDGMYTYPSEQTYTAAFVDRNGEYNAKQLFQRLGRYGWITAKSRDSASYTVRNWAKLVSIDSGYDPNNWASSNSESNKYTLTFACSPFWYEDADTTTAITSTGFRTVTNNGNARSTWWTLYITSAITAPLTINISRSSGATYGVPTYGNATYDASGYQTITYNANKAVNVTLMIDARANLVTVNGIDDYADITLPATQVDLGYLYPGNTRFTFSQPITGQIVHRGAYV